ncbi:hypothetical protein VTK26DRAFT_5493 [Humicola hyalothermophila]
MALISAKTIITSLSLFHITLAFFFLTNPATVADQAVVYLLGESMGLPHSRSFDTQSPALAFLAVVLGLFGITDLVSLSLPDEIGLLHHWGLQAPVRLTLTFFLALYSFFFSPSSPFFYNINIHHNNPSSLSSSGPNDSPHSSSSSPPPPPPPPPTTRASPTPRPTTRRTTTRTTRPLAGAVTRSRTASSSPSSLSRPSAGCGCG